MANCWEPDEVITLSIVAIPIYDTTIVLPLEGTEIVKAPSTPVMADTALPLIDMVAPCNGSPVALLVTLPATCNVWEKPQRGIQKNSNTVHNSNVILRLISKQLLAAKEFGFVYRYKAIQN
jgi:hypothetical protein